ncbi:hypothetical protein OROMI_017391 [Orobanche minor]
MASAMRGLFENGRNPLAAFRNAPVSSHITAPKLVLVSLSKIAASTIHLTYPGGGGFNVVGLTGLLGFLLDTRLLLLFQLVLRAAAVMRTRSVDQECSVHTTSFRLFHIWSIECYIFS